MDIISQKIAKSLYCYTIENNNNTLNQDFVVDTGAVSSTLTFSLLTNLLSRDVDIEYIDGCDRKFLVANDSEVDAFLCRFKNITLYGIDEIQNIQIPYFYVYVVLNVDAQTKDGKTNKNIRGLLGLDFIDTCSFKHTENGNFIITNFDYATYIEKHNNYILKAKQKVNAIPLTKTNINNLLSVVNINDIEYLYECIGTKQENKQTYYNIRHIETAKTKWIDRKTFIEFKQKHSPCNDVKNIVIQTSEQGTTYARYVKGS